MYLTFKYRLYPTRAQDAALHAQVDEACALYNAALEERRMAWKLARRSVSFYDQDKQLKEIRATGDLAISNFMVARDVLRRVDRAFDGFFRRVKAGQKAGYPRFRSRQRYDSMTFSDGYHLRAADRLSLQGVGEVKIKSHRPLQGTSKTVTVKREAGRWFALFNCIVEPAPLPPSDEAIGIDLGLTMFATLSDGTEIANPRCARTAQRTLRIAQRRVARRKKGSKGRKQAVQLLHRAHRHVFQQRADFHHKAARTLVNCYGLIAVEDLNVHGLAASRVASSVHDAGWAAFLAKLDYKAESAGRRVVRVNPAGTTQRCSGCGVIIPKALSQRWHACSSCGLSLSRDENAAREILRLGLSREALTWPAGACVASEVSKDSQVTLVVAGAKERKAYECK